MNIATSSPGGDSPQTAYSSIFERFEALLGIDDPVLQILELDTQARAAKREVGTNIGTFRRAFEAYRIQKINQGKQS